jgi:hypothetical protein
MTAKEYLQQIRKIDLLIQNKLEQAQELRSKLEVKGINFESDGSTSATRNVTKMNDLIVSVVTLEEEINQQIDLLINKKREVMELIDSLDNADEISLLYKRYFNYKKWEEIAVDMNYTYRGILKIHGRALQNLEKVFTKVHIDMC